MRTNTLQKLSGFTLDSMKIIRKGFLPLLLMFVWMMSTNETYGQWYKIPQLQYTNIYCMLTTADSTIFVGGDGGTLLRSTDAGMTWTSVMGNGFFVDTVLSLGEGLGYVFAGANGVEDVYRTSNNGDNWSPAHSGLPTGIKMNAFAFSDSLLFVATDYGVYSSADSGSTWQIDTTGLGLGPLYPGQFGGTSGVVAVGSKLYTIKLAGGSVYSSSADTISWKQVSTDYYNTGYGMAAIDTNIFISTQKGIYLYEGGTNWIARNNGLPVNDTTFIISSMLTTSDTLLFAYILPSSGSKGLYVTSDLGNTWKQVNDSVFTTVSIKTIVASRDYLFAGTQMGGWRIPVSDVITSINKKGSELPTGFHLEQNYPNPFNPSTIISYQLPVRSYVTLKVYDILGREVATLVNEVKNAGSYSLTFNASNLATGIYLYKLQAGTTVQVRKMILLK